MWSLNTRFTQLYCQRLLRLRLIPQRYHISCLSCLSCLTSLSAHPASWALFSLIILPRHPHWVRTPFTLSPLLPPQLVVIFITNQLTTLNRHCLSDHQSEKLSNYSLLSLSAFSVHRVQHRDDWNIDGGCVGCDWLGSPTLMFRHVVRGKGSAVFSGFGSQRVWEGSLLQG